MDFYSGQLVVLRSKWSIYSHRIGLVVGSQENKEDVLLVMWTIKDGFRMKYHLKDAVIPINDLTLNKIKERACAIR